MGRRTYSREFKISAVGLVQQQGYTVVQAAKSLGIDPASLRGWLKQFSAGGASAVDQAGSVQAELRRLREENRRLLMERDLKKSDGLLRQGAAMRYAFIHQHRKELPWACMCRVLEVCRSGYYAWRGRATVLRSGRSS